MCTFEQNMYTIKSRFRVHYSCTLVYIVYMQYIVCFRTLVLLNSPILLPLHCCCNHITTSAFVVRDMPPLASLVPKTCARYEHAEQLLRNRHLLVGECQKVKSLMSVYDVSSSESKLCISIVITVCL